MELVERLRELSGDIRYNGTPRGLMVEAADLLDEALKAVGAANKLLRTFKENRVLFGPTPAVDDFIAKTDAILTKSRGEKIDG